MSIEKYFIKNKKNSYVKINELFKELNEKVNKYNTDSNNPLLTGKVDYYNKITDKKHLSVNPKEISEVFEDFSQLFQRAVVWENAGTMINITPPANIASIVSAYYTALFNPNFAQDEPSGYLLTTELLVTKYLSELVGWDYKKSGGVFTFGGKGTNLYATKIGLRKALPNVIDEGINGKKIVVFSSEKSHPCHKEVCDWLGLGKNSCYRLQVDKNGQVDLTELEFQLRNNIENGNIIGCIIVNGGTTNEIYVDPIKEVVQIRDKIVEEYHLDYIPHVHVDAVIGWAWLFYKEYDFNKNELAMSKKELDKIMSMKNKISQIEYADSFGADFHKTGFCPYVSSIYMDKNYSDILALGNKQNKGQEYLRFGEYSPFEYTLELTRSSIGPVSAYVALETFGIKGFQELIYNVFSHAEFIREYLGNQNNFEVINPETEGIATLFVITPEGNNKKYTEYLTGSPEIEKSFIEYNHQFYLFCLKKLEEGVIHFKITFSKSYKPYGFKNPTGALKIYPTSPITTNEEIEKCLRELIEMKKEFDLGTKELKDDREGPVDFVYRE